MLDSLLEWLWRTQGFVQRSECGVGWKEHPGLAFATQIADVLIWFCYCLIPICLVIAYRAWNNGLVIRDHKTGAALFVGFIMTCGFTHFMDRLLFFTPAYGLDCVIRVLCASCSVSTVMWLMLPERYIPRD
jgi:hypothetical protein